MSSAVVLTKQAWLLAMPVYASALCSRALCGERLSTAAGLVGVWIDELEISAHEIFVIVELRSLEIDCALGVNDDLDAIEVIDLIVLTDLLVKIDRVAQARAASSFDAKAKPPFRDALDVDQAFDFLDRRLRQGDHRRLSFSIRGIHEALLPAVTCSQPSSDSRPTLP